MRKLARLTYHPHTVSPWHIHTPEGEVRKFGMLFEAEEWVEENNWELDCV